MFSPDISQGLNLDKLPPTTRRDLFRMAKSRGWTPMHWTSKKNVLLVALAARDLRDDGRVEAINALDRVWHQLMSWTQGKGILRTAGPSLALRKGENEIVVDLRRVEEDEKSGPNTPRNKALKSP